MYDSISAIDHLISSHLSSSHLPSSHLLSFRHSPPAMPSCAAHASSILCSIFSFNLSSLFSLLLSHPSHLSPLLLSPLTSPPPPTQTPPRPGHTIPYHPIPPRPLQPRVTSPPKGRKHLPRFLSCIPPSAPHRCFTQRPCPSSRAMALCPTPASGALYVGR